MADRPDNIRQIAKQVAVSIFESSYLSRSVQGAVEDIIARALVAATEAEREACAWLVEHKYFSPEPFSRAARYHEKNVVRPNLAAAIRQRGEAVRP